jgi:hypothetical protein
MSAIELQKDHLVALVNIGLQLDIRNVYDEHRNLTQRLDLNEQEDRTYVLTELITQMRTSIAYRYDEGTPHASQPLPVSAGRAIPIPLHTIGDVAQALQWVRCYEYQSSEEPNWPTSFAQHFTNMLTQALITKVISAHTTSWTYNGPALS